ncbi:D-xylose transporter XylE [Prevotella sp. E15-22]|uniref:D-xylose transporter XylE n=1 Tax=Prevotella sp. E15-22 TaxID=2937774 RepID=UPI00206C287E|nr:D-xylose transporter XylE [Prevotella sp. E15-22]UPS43512.1 D-xylose transporter XylE [Prevotella sp. E15-22]
MAQNENGSRGYLISIVMVAVLGGLLFGYDTAVISGAEKGLQAFFKTAGDFDYTDGWHGFTSASALIGCIIGSAISGFLATNLGRKKSLIIAGLLFFISALGSMDPEFLFFEYGHPSYSLALMFNFYRVIGGIGVGLASAICPMYIGEVAPSGIRGMLVSWNQFAIIFGQLVVYFVNFFILGDHIQPAVEEMGKTLASLDPKAVWTVETGWRYMFGSEAVPAGLFALLICFVPETPRYLVSIGQDQKALGILSKINGSSKATQILQDIKDTMVVKTEKLMTYGFVCIFVGIMLSVFQQAVGINAVLYYAPRIFGDMGMDNPMILTVFMGIVNILFTLVAIFTVEKWGRKPLLIWGSIGMAIGALGVAISFGHAGLEFVTAASIMVYAASFMFSWGPITWVLIAEIFPNTIRGGAVAIAVAFQWIFNFIVSSTFVPMFNMHLTEGDDFGHWFTYGLYGLICLLAALFVWKMVPETKGKTLEDMTAMWKNRKQQ